MSARIRAHAAAVILAAAALAGAVIAPAAAEEIAYQAVPGACGQRPAQVVWRADAAFYADIAASCVAGPGVDRILGRGERARCQAGCRAGSRPLENGWRTAIPAGCVTTSTGLGYQGGRLPEMSRAFLEYDICFSAGFDFRGAKLLGLQAGAGGAAAGGGADCAGVSARGMAHRIKACDRFECAGGSNYIYWCEQPHAYGYCGADCYWDGGKPLFRPGRCYRIGQQLTMNAPGERNGAVRVWVDGRLVNELKDLLFRPAGASWRINKVRFGHHGGGSTDWKLERNVAIDVHDLKVWTDPPFCEGK